MYLDTNRQNRRTPPNTTDVPVSSPRHNPRTSEGAHHKERFIRRRETRQLRVRSSAPSAAQLAPNAARLIQSPAASADRHRRTVSAAAARKMESRVKHISALTAHCAGMDTEELGLIRTHMGSGGHAGSSYWPERSQAIWVGSAVNSARREERRGVF